MSSNSAPRPTLQPTGVHHVAIIASDYARSRRFYTEVLGLQVVHEYYRGERQSYKLDLQLPDGTQVELFSFPEPPARPSYPEACGLRHLALRVADMQASVAALAAHGVAWSRCAQTRSPGRCSPFLPTRTGCRSSWSVRRPAPRRTDFTHPKRKGPCGPFSCHISSLQQYPSRAIIALAARGPQLPAG